MQQPPIDQSEIDARIEDHVEELLHLWWAEQGSATKDRDLQIVSSSVPARRDRALRTVDLCCGPGDLGRAIRQNHPTRRSTSSIVTRSCCRSVAGSTTGRECRERTDSS